MLMRVRIGHDWGQEDVMKMGSNDGGGNDKVQRRWWVCASFTAIVRVIPALVCVSPTSLAPSRPRSCPHARPPYRPRTHPSPHPFPPSFQPRTADLCRCHFPLPLPLLPRCCCCCCGCGYCCWCCAYARTPSHPPPHLCVSALCAPSLLAVVLHHQ
jgi:hypothetical protein